jgi:hypothetical protein
MEVQGSYDIRGRDLDQRFARFGTVALTDDEICALSMASMVMPEGSPGGWAYLTQVSGVDCYALQLSAWGRMVAEGIAAGRHCSHAGRRRRTYVEGYDESWGRYAVADGLSLAIFGHAPGEAARCESLKVGRQPYRRIRDFVGGAIVLAMAEYRCALEWAMGRRRDRLFQGRWEGITGLKWSELKTDAMMGRERGEISMLAPGCHVVGDKRDADDRLKFGGSDPETLYLGLRATDWWSEGYARMMRKTCPVRVIYAPPRK